MSTSEVYTVSEMDIESGQLSARLTAILLRISDRLDQLEGARGVAEVQGGIKVSDRDANLLHGLGDV